MNDRDENRRFESLLGRLLEGGLNDEDRLEFGRFLEHDPSRRFQYLDYCQMHGLLRAEHGLLSSWQEFDEELPPLNAPRQKPAWRGLRSLVGVGVAAAVVAVLAAVVARSSRIPPATSTPPFRGDVVARLQKQVDARFLYVPAGEAAPPAGTAMPQGAYELCRGIIELQSESGVVLTLEAPASFTLLDRQGVRIDRGRVAAHVPRQATGFRVEIPNGTVIDLGTDFAVDAVQGEKSEVHVFNGKVQINLSGSKARGASPLHLTTGEAASIDYATGMPSGIDLDEQRFLRNLASTPRTYTQRVLELQPAVYYPMEPASDGATLRDVAFHRADAKIFFGEPRKSVWAAGKVGLALELGGPAQRTYAVAPEYPQAEGDELSVAAWVMAESRPRWGSIAKNWAGSDQWGQFHFGLHYDSGELEAHIQDSSGQEIMVKDSAPIPLRVWHHVAFVADGKTLHLYRNGEEVDGKPSRQLRRDPRIKALAIGTKLNLKADAPDSHDYNMWDGRLDELAIFNHALTPRQVRELFELGSVGVR
ncbi:MAG: FecR domain-containing protein [Pirellulales bacterium]|nr:FecR domain-containing protein [Pirellulales bacterium]